MTYEIRLTRIRLSQLVIIAMFAGATLGFVIGFVCGVIGK